MRLLPAEWHKQRAVLMAFPHKNTDWAEIGLEKALSPFIRIAQAIAYKTLVFILCDDKEKISNMFCSTFNMVFIEINTNDTWTRDYGYISILEDGVKLLDFNFNGWGGKFEASLDNSVNRKLHKMGYLGTTPLESIDFVLEGGSIDSDGEGTILTTSKCLCNKNRNGGLSKEEVEEKFREFFGTKRVLWLDYGYLAGDDTDSHIDTLARFVSKDTICYVECRDRNDEHYFELNEMKKELESFKTLDGKAYNLVPLPMPSPKYYNGKRLPATYANFLITNGTLIYPTYSVKEDKIAGEIFKSLFPDREIIPIECSRLITQGGSLHCSTMQIL
jgi:agmatine deiminase